MDKKSEDRGETLRRAGPYLSLGTTFAASLLLFPLLGYWADGKLGTRPWLALTGVFLGLLVGTVNFITVVMHRPPE